MNPAPFLNMSIVIPVCDEEGNIDALYQGILATGLEVSELIFVDDGSRDRTFERIENLAARDGRVKAISFSRNFGHQAALFAGLRLARGERVVIMDGDLQHPPDLIPLLLAKYREGYDIVSAKRTETADAGIFKRWSSRVYYRLLNFISDTRIEENVADFRLMNRKVVDSILRFEERELFIRGIISWIGFRSATIPFKAPPRSRGHSKYSMSGMMSLGLKGAVSFSYKPLRISLLIGIIVSLAAFCFAAFSIVAYFRGRTVPGWTSLITAVMFIGGIQLIVLGLMGEYIASLFREVKKRPMFIIDRTVNTGDE
jgi:polyisoprenyl-phosphate glycosyltransferase